MTRFSEMTFENGKLVETRARTIKQSDIGRCPHVIFDIDHYRDDGTCRCNDESHTDMANWGYVWRDGEWRSGPEDDEQ